MCLRLVATQPPACAPNLRDNVSISGPRTIRRHRRAATSVPTNLAEGSKRRQTRDCARFIYIAEASLAETEYLLILSHDLSYLHETPAALLAEIAEISRMLHTRVSQANS